MKLFCLFIAMTTCGLMAHDITLFPSAKAGKVGIEARYGHPGDHQQATLAKMLDLAGYAPGGGRTDYVTQAKVDGLSIRLAPIPAVEGVWVFATRYDNGFYLKTPDGRSVSTTRREMPQATASTHNIKFGKALAMLGKSGDGYQIKVGHRLELIPQSNPFALHAGDKLPVMVLFDGKPLSGAGVEIGDGETPRKEADIPRYSTDAKGVAMVPVGKDGPQVIGVDYKVRSADPQLADDDAYTATLTFQLAR